MTVSFKGNPVTTIIIAYAPTENGSTTEKDALYQDLHTSTVSIPLHSITIVAGDFNARIGKDSHLSNPRAVGRYTYHDKTNNNGNRLVEYCEACGMRSSQFRFRQPRGRIWTWEHSNGRSKAQLDHILINGKWLNSIKNARAYDTVELNSDHRILSVRAKLSLRAPKPTTESRIKYDWSKIASSSALQTQFELEVKNRFDVLSNLNTNPDLQVRYNNFVQSLGEIYIFFNEQFDNYNTNLYLIHFCCMFLCDVALLIISTSIGHFVIM
jgi:hypothetical protein